MSRIGKQPIRIPEGVTIKLEENNRIVKIKGFYGEFEHILESYHTVLIKDEQLYLININEKKDSKKFHGLYRTLLANKIQGAAELFKKVLITKGVGYKFQLLDKKLILSAGYSHPIEFEIPSTLKIEIEANTKLILLSSNKEELGLFASKIRNIRPPEPYKGKGIMYENENIRRKVGKIRKN